MSSKEDGKAAGENLEEDKKVLLDRWSLKIGADMENTLYLECYSGISGDMTVASLLDLGADKEVLRQALNSLPVKGFQIDIKRVKKSGIDACDFCVILDEMYENSDHDMEYLYGHEKEEASEEREQEHTHTANQDKRHSHTHEHRGIKEIEEIIRQGQMTENAKMLALKIFSILAEAEAKAHCVPVEKVHFHEVGAVDSIVDIIAAAVCLDNLKITKVIVPELWEGTGTVRCRHGILPVPVPAVVNIVKAHDLKLHIMAARGEFITPTGAAITAAIKTSEKLPADFKILRVGVGAGKREYEQPGILRAMLIEEEDGEEEICKADCKDSIWKLESDIDDCTGEVLGYVMERLFQAGARDVHYIPVFMKKNRPAWQLNVICNKRDMENLEQIIFEETTTIGIRKMELERTLLSREQIKMNTVFGEAEVKVCTIGGKKRFYPEYESVVRICRERKLPYMVVYQTICQACKEPE